ncbi:MAG TPA: dihydropteroate synthase, partial [Betaproteobacteria bacterium]|nr:dihydropteroate synthase [Betaproteobacteria bacterium]
MFHCGRFRFELTHPLVMGILNVTPDSFFDGSRHSTVGSAVARARQMMDEGAAIIDVGGESTRPGAAPVTAQEEQRRVLPVIEALAALSIPVSVDTRQPLVMQAAIAAGADMINDISALQTEDALRHIAGSNAAVCLMHMRGTPSTMQREPHYRDVVAEVTGYLAARLAVAEAAGIGRERLVVDPGFGFGKNLTHNLTLLRRLSHFRAL